MASIENLVQSIYEKLERDPQWVRHHGFGGLVYKYLGEKIYRSDYMRNRQLNTILLSETREITHRAKEWGINITPIKGADLAESLYDDPFVRPMTDIDVLGPEKVSAALLDSGYREIPEKKWQGNHHKKSFSRKLGETDITVEVHHSLYADHHVSEYQSWEEKWLYLSSHYCHQHTLLRLIWLADLWEIDRKFTLDYEAILDAAGRIQRVRSCRMAMESIQQFPESVNPQFRDFLLFPKKSLTRYFWQKHKTRDSISSALRYDFQWLKHCLKMG